MYTQCICIHTHNHSCSWSLLCNVRRLSRDSCRLGCIILSRQSFLWFLLSYYHLKIRQFVTQAGYLYMYMWQRSWWYCSHWLVFQQCSELSELCTFIVLSLIKSCTWSLSMLSACHHLRYKSECQAFCEGVNDQFSNTLQLVTRMGSTL